MQQEAAVAQVRQAPEICLEGLTKTTKNLRLTFRRLTSKVAFYIFIQQIEVPNIINMMNTVRFFLFKMQFVS